jgi:outer membrane protein TolC
MRRQKRGLRLLPLVIVLALAALAAAEAGTQPQSLDLAAAMRRARENAPEVAAAAARQRAQQARTDEARAHRLPVVSLSESWIRTDSPADVFGLLLNQERFSIAEFFGSNPNDPAPLESATTRLEVAVPVYTGGEISTRIAQARHAEEAAGAALDRAGELAAFEAGEAYVRLFQAGEEVALLERGLATVEAHAALARAFVEEGMAIHSELLRAEVEAARLRDELSAARGRARIAEAALSLQLGSPLDERWSIAPLGEPLPVGDALEAWLARSEGRSDLAAARRRVAAAALEARAIRARRLPRVGFSARYDLVDETPFGTDGDNHAVMARASIELFAGGRHRAAEAAARAETEAAEREIELMAQGIRLEVRAAHVGAEVARERLATAHAALAAASETERILQERFRQGLVKTVDLLDATTARTQAETRAAVALAEAHLGTLRLALAAGAAAEHPTTTRDDDGGSR